MLHFFVTPFWIVCVHIYVFCNLIYELILTLKTFTPRYYCKCCYETRAL